MKQVTIQLDTIDKVRNFVQTISLFNSDFDMVSGRYTVDGKSILGIFSLDLSKPIDLVIYDDREVSDILKQIDEYLV